MGVKRSAQRITADAIDDARTDSGCEDARIGARGLPRCKRRDGGGECARPNGERGAPEVVEFAFHHCCFHRASFHDVVLLCIRRAVPAARPPP